MNNLHTVELRLTETKIEVMLSDLTVCADMQMRTNVSQDLINDYASDIEKVLELHPIMVVEVEGPVATDWYVVDGFHRVHAALQAELTKVPAMLMKGTYEQARTFALSSNWTHGKRPRGEDAVKAIASLLETAPDFGYNANAVVDYLRNLGILKRTAQMQTIELRDSIKAKRDAEIMRRLEEGESGRSIAKLIGCDEGTVRTIKKSAEKTQVAQNPHQESPIAPQSQLNATSSSSDLPTSTFLFPDEECEEVEIINPQDALNELLAEQEKKKKAREVKEVAKEAQEQKKLKSEEANNETEPFVSPIMLNINNNISIDNEKSLASAISQLIANSTLPIADITLILEQQLEALGQTL